MTGIFNVLKSIGEFISSVVQFVVKILGDLVYMVKLMSLTVAKIPSLLGFFPTTIILIFSTCLVVIIIYKILGRD